MQEPHVVWVLCQVVEMLPKPAVVAGKDRVAGWEQAALDQQMAKMVDQLWFFSIR